MISCAYLVLHNFLAGNIAGDSPSYRDMVINLGIIDPLLEILKAPPSKVSMVRNAVWCISNLCRGKNPPPDFNKVSIFYIYIVKLSALK